jgi:hydroxyacylglutathione hydrolase
VSSSDEFVDECIRLDNLPAVPPYWRRMRDQNLAGPAPLGLLREPPALPPVDFEAAMSDEVFVVDTRSAEGFAGGHIPGAVNVILNSSFPTWAGTVLPGDAHVLLVLEEPDKLWEATWGLLRIGYDLPVGWLAGGMSSWRSSGRPLKTLHQMTVHEVKEKVSEGAVRVVDVRQPAEWAAGHIEGAEFLTGAYIPARAEEIGEDLPVVFVCGSGNRSSVAASYLMRLGRDDVSNVIGGMGAWYSAGYPTEK